MLDTRVSRQNEKRSHTSCFLSFTIVTEEKNKTKQSKAKTPRNVKTEQILLGSGLEFITKNHFFFYTLIRYSGVFVCRNTIVIWNIHIICFPRCFFFRFFAVVSLIVNDKTIIIIATAPVNHWPMLRMLILNMFLFCLRFRNCLLPANTIKMKISSRSICRMENAFLKMRYRFLSLFHFFCLFETRQSNVNIKIRNWEMDMIINYALNDKLIVDRWSPIADRRSLIGPAKWSRMYLQWKEKHVR